MLLSPKPVILFRLKEDLIQHINSLFQETVKCALPTHKLLKHYRQERTPWYNGGQMPYSARKAIGVMFFIPGADLPS